MDKRGQEVIKVDTNGEEEEAKDDGESMVPEEKAKGFRSIRVITVSAEFKPNLTKETHAGFVCDKHLYKLAKLILGKGIKCQVVTDDKESS